jgi:murein DD-endopeptidase MepM/ murein hydrolase activator NlpD
MGGGGGEVGVAGERKAGAVSAASMGAMLIAILAAPGCFRTSPQPAIAPTPAGSVSQPTSHTVRSGETIYRIAKLYGMSVGRLMAANQIDDPRLLRVGQILVIPGGYRYGSNAQSNGTLASMYPIERSPRQFTWPVRAGVLSSGYGVRNGVMHDGIDISAPTGTPVVAADDGAVIYSGALKGYGNIVIVRHDNRYVTVYAHNEYNLVREGARVVRGQQVGVVGASGRTTGANLHFEVRRDNLARNPLSHLPAVDDTPGIVFAGGGGS